MNYNTSYHLKYSLNINSKSGYTCFVFCISQVFRYVLAKHTTKYETFSIHFLYFMRIFYFINAAKKKLQNPLTFRANADPDAKCFEMQKAKKGVRNAKKVT